ncbi:MAG: GHKL domain-containing protein [Clostridia bacterium]|nr:GHKL domain-containing protein [Clostridia bacterium]
MTAAISAISYLTIIPAACMCYWPMQNQLRFSKGRIIRDCVILFVFGSAGLLALDTLLGSTEETVTLLPFLCLFCLYYVYSTRASISQNLGLFFAVCALMTIASELAYIVSDLFGGERVSSTDSLVSNLVQAAFAVLLAVIFYRPLRRDGTYMIDNLRINWIWLCSIPVSAGAFIVLVLTAPMIISEDDGPAVYGRFLAIALVIIVLYCFMLFAFLRISKALMSEDQLKAQETVFKMQRQQYETMAHTLEENKIMRHDQKHAMRLARKLLQTGKVDEVIRYLDVRLETMPTDSVHKYCEDGILNAVLNYIADRCEELEIDLELDIDIPKMEEHQAVDVANYLQNLADNAIYGCETVPPQDRRFALTVKAPYGEELFIVSTNSFDGYVRKEDRDYRSTRAEGGGTGLGIPSMRAIASKYGGTLEIHNTETAFMVDARIKLL